MKVLFARYLSSSGLTLTTTLTVSSDIFGYSMWPFKEYNFYKKNIESSNKIIKVSTQVIWLSFMIDFIYKSHLISNHVIWI